MHIDREVSSVVFIRLASLQQLCYYHQRGDPRQLKLRAAMLASLEPPYRDLHLVLAWLHALSWLGPAPDQDTSDGCAAAAGALATELMYGVAETFRQLVTDAHKVFTAELNAKPLVLPTCRRMKHLSMLAPYATLKRGMRTSIQSDPGMVVSYLHHFIPTLRSCIKLMVHTSAFRTTQGYVQERTYSRGFHFVTVQIMSDMPGSGVRWAQAADAAGKGGKGRVQGLLQDIGNKLDAKDNVHNGGRDQDATHLNTLLSVINIMTRLICLPKCM